MPWIRYQHPSYGLSSLSVDSLLDMLQFMGEVGRNRYSPSRIRAAFEEAARRKIVTPDEAIDGARICLRIPLRKRPEDPWQSPA